MVVERGALLAGLCRIRWHIAKPFALALFRHRSRRRNNTRYPICWRTGAGLIADELLLIRDEDGEQAINSTFIEQMKSGRAEAQKVVTQRSAIAGILTAYLLLAAFSIQLDVSVGGFVLKTAPGLNEILLVYLTLLLALTVAPFLNIIVLNNVIKGAIAAVYPEPTRYFHKVSLFPDEPPVFFIPYYRPRLIWTRAMRFSSSATIGYLSVMVLGFLLFLLLSRFFIYRHILTYPSLPEPWSMVIALGCLVVEVWSFIYILLFLVPLPYRDYALLEKFEILDFVNPAEAAKAREEAFRREWEDRQDMIRRGYLQS
jgi:hypothetical protein